MKLIGSSSKGKRVARGNSGNSGTRAAVTTPGRTGKKKMSKVKKTVIITISLLGLIVLLAGSAAAILYYGGRDDAGPFVKSLYEWLYGIDPDNLTPGLNSPPPTSDGNIDPDNPAIVDNTTEPAPDNRPLEEIRNVNKLTFLILGIDGYKGLRSQGGANTDVVMIASYDMDKQDIRVTSIPRDTIVNVPWSVKKINSIWANMRSRYGGTGGSDTAVMDETKAHFANLLGFEVDYWVTLDMEAFVSLVNAMPGGGVKVKVPSSIALVDPDIGLNVRLSAGEQTLTGMQALAFMRYRGYGDGDFGRMEAQQIFLKAAAEQLLAGKNSLDPVELVNLLLKNVKTDMDATAAARIGREMFKISSDNIGFKSAPATMYNVRGSGAGSYVYLHLDEWLEIVNDDISPFYDEITPEHVSILTLNENNKFYVTDNNWQGSQSWGN